MLQQLVEARELAGPCCVMQGGVAEVILVNLMEQPQFTNLLLLQWGRGVCSWLWFAFGGGATPQMRQPPE